MQEEKQLNPASRRVRDAAEHLLSVVMEQVEKINIWELPTDRRRNSWTKTPIPKCRLYWFFCLGWCNNFAVNIWICSDFIPPLCLRIKKNSNARLQGFLFERSCTRETKQ